MYKTIEDFLNYEQCNWQLKETVTISVDKLIEYIEKEKKEKEKLKDRSNRRVSLY